MSRNKIFAVLLMLGLLLLVIYLIMPQTNPGRVKDGRDVGSEARAEVIFLDVGQGDAILIQEGNLQILIDGGDGRHILGRLGEFMPWSDRKIELMIVTHPDKDHMGGLIKVLENYEVGEILEPGISCSKDICEKWDQLISGKNISSTDAMAGMDIQFEEDVHITILYPFENLSGRTFSNSNEASIVMKATVEGRKYLLTGDMESKAEKALIGANLDLDVDVLKISHHGSKSATTPEFLQETTPEKAVISVGKNSYGHPAEEILTRLRNMNIEVLRTDEAGSVRF